MMKQEHEAAHRNAEKGFRAQAKELRVNSGYDRHSREYRKAERLETLGDLHYLAAGGTMKFDDCAECMSEAVRS